MRLCLVGHGAIAEKHMEALSRFADIEPYVLVGRRIDPTTCFAKKWGFSKYYLDYDQALSDNAIDIVVITSPNELHVEHTEKALVAGKHILLEIPIALNAIDAERITKMARESNSCLMIAHTMRFFPALKEVRRRIHSGELKIHQIIGFIGLLRRTNVTSAGKPRSWVDDLLWHFGAHMVDAALWVTGHTRTTNVSCHLGPQNPTQGVMDLSLGMSLPGGELVTINQSFNISKFRWTIVFIGEETTLEFNMNGLYDAKGTIIVPQQSIVDLYEQDLEFINAIREKRDPAITGEDILSSMRILHHAQSIAIRN